MFNLSYILIRPLKIEEEITKGLAALYRVIEMLLEYNLKGPCVWAISIISIHSGLISLKRSSNRGKGVIFKTQNPQSLWSQS
jgi:hypothetical protein